MMGRKKKTAEPANTPVTSLPPLRLEWLDPADLAENPANWRRHPENQLAALTDVIAEVGWAGACLFNERTGRLIDGHGRRKVALEQGCKAVPVLVGNWSEEQERKILATLDPIAGLATADAPALDALLRDVQTGSEAVATMLQGLATTAGLCYGDLSEPKADDAAAPDDFQSYDESIPTEHQCPKCGYRWSGTAGEVPADEPVAELDGQGPHEGGVSENQSG